MCLKVKPICNACKTNALPEELHECIFPHCIDAGNRTRFLSRRELLKWDCHTPDCGLNMKTINDMLNEIHRTLRMEEDISPRPAEGDSVESHDDNHDGQAGPSFHGFDGDGTPLTHSSRRATGVDVTPNDDVSPNNSVAANENAASNDGVATNDSVAANDTSATNDNAAANESVETVFDPDSVDLDTFPRCRHCFLGRRRCDGQTPCDKCRQRRCPGACRPVTVELLRQYPARAERILELARRNGASS